MIFFIKAQFVWKQNVFRKTFSVFSDVWGAVKPKSIENQHKLTEKSQCKIRKMVYGKFFCKPFSKTRVRLPLDSASHPAPHSCSLSLSLSYTEKQAIRLSMGPSESSWLRAVVGLELGSELVVEGGAMGLEVELVVELMVDRSLDLRSKPAQIRIQ